MRQSRHLATDGAKTALYSSQNDGILTDFYSKSAFSSFSTVYDENCEDDIHIYTGAYHEDTGAESRKWGMPTVINPKQFNYYSSNKNVFTVDKNGIIKIKKSGKATLTVALKSDSSVKYKREIKFVKNVDVSLSKRTILPDDTFDMSDVVVRNKKGKVIPKKYYRFENNYSKSVGRHIAEIYSAPSSPVDFDVSLAYYILPKGTKIKSLKPKRGALTVNWKTQKTGTSGYEIQYSTSKNFNGAITKRIKGNKKKTDRIQYLKSGKKYYVRIRTYKKEPYEDVYYYSNWSKVKTVKIK